MFQASAMDQNDWRRRLMRLTEMSAGITPGAVQATVKLLDCVCHCNPRSEKHAPASDLTGPHAPFS